ncbi:Arginase/deacetylase [Artomyces pyxidatus]|uniref:Arginase/deacetylase n=1 Tax=Artomyces pyxidatus TaxID=48021 RepID=A0ACB8TDU2_9AGAM|nr:Arginase/deacetylase [Artomyces pyxidatus]
MKVVYDADCLLHDPPYEILSGQLVPYYESPQRLVTIKQRLESSDLFELVGSERDIDVLKFIAMVHSSDYVEYLMTAYQRWVEDGGDRTAVLPETFPHPKLLVGLSHSPEHLSPIAKAGLYCFDLSCPITEPTYISIIASARVALSAAAVLADSTQPHGPKYGVFALSRPPGHHAGTSLCGGYCFVNNVAVAARFLQSRAGLGATPLPIAILDVDYHHGNGTQEVFYSDRSVLYVSLHAQNDYPYFTGTASEMGSGAGLGFNLNHPLPRGTQDDAYCAELVAAVAQVRAFSPAYVLVSLGVDTYIDDPISDFALTEECYARMGEIVAGLDRPTLFVMEG